MTYEIIGIDSSEGNDSTSIATVIIRPICTAEFIHITFEVGGKGMGMATSLEEEFFSRVEA